jgi:hypothetical protein
VLQELTVEKCGNCAKQDEIGAFVDLTESLPIEADLHWSGTIKT